MKIAEKEFYDRRSSDKKFSGAAAALIKNGLPAKLITVALALVISAVFLNAMTESRDGRHSVISAEGGNEYSDAVKTDEEIRLQNILECISGVGSVRVMIQGSESSQERSSLVFAPSFAGSSEKNGRSDGDSGGVIVVAEGGGDPNVRSRITDAVSTVCGIDPSDVVVFELR